MILGTVQLGMEYGVGNTNGKPSDEAAYAILEVARQGGVRLLDTAAGYGDSEARIGRFLERNHRAFGVCTKLPVTQEREAETAGWVETAVRERLETLHVETLSCCYLHRFEQFREPGVMKALLRERESGTVERVGVSIYRPVELDEICRSGLPVDVVQVPYNVLSAIRWEGALDRAAERGVTLYARSVFLQGLIFMDPTSEMAMRIGASRYLRSLDALAKAANCGIAEYCYGFVISSPYVDDVLVGCETIGQLRDSLAMQKRVPRFTKQMIDEARRTFADVAESVVDPTLWPKAGL